MDSSDLADSLASAHGLTRSDARKLVDGVFAAVSDTPAKGKKVSLIGFRKLKDKPAREGRNPSTEATVQIAASKTLTLRRPSTS
jgi:DNA-binding protein HU-beta